MTAVHKIHNALASGTLPLVLCLWYLASHSGCPTEGPAQVPRLSSRLYGFPASQTCEAGDPRVDSSRVCSMGSQLRRRARLGALELIRAVLVGGTLRAFKILELVHLGTLGRSRALLLLSNLSVGSCISGLSNSPEPTRFPCAFGGRLLVPASRRRPCCQAPYP